MNQKSDDKEKKTNLQPLKKTNKLARKLQENIKRRKIINEKQ